MTDGKQRRRSAFSLLGASALALAACTNESPSLRLVTVLPAGDTPIRFSADVQPIFNRSCAINSGCHTGPGAPFGFVLDEGKAYANLVGVPSAEVTTLHRVEPGRSDLSYIINKLTGIGNLGDRMPATGNYLSDAEIQLVRDWIDQGAEDN